ncbi:DUF6414 family protein [Listeria monocytogenes]|nr:hypothetical protein [Listeria monocytogenes]
MAETLKKIIYFDEKSAMDLLQIEKKGNFNKTIELITATDGKADGSVKVQGEIGKQGFLNKLFQHGIGLSASAGAELGIEGSVEGHRIATTILENSLLYDFLTTVESKRGKQLLDISEGYKLIIDKSSMTYYATVAPIAEMLEGNQYLDDTSGISMAMSKMNTGIKSTKGYFDLIGKKTIGNSEETRVYRFNIDSFKNNYRIHDLKKMDLKLYSIYVGQTTLEELDFETEFDLVEEQNETDFSGILKEKKTKENNKNILSVYDVFLAGVK